MSRTRPWQQHRKNKTEIQGGVGETGQSVATLSSWSRSGPPPLLRPATFHYRGLAAGEREESECKAPRVLSEEEEEEEEDRQARDYHNGSVCDHADGGIGGDSDPCVVVHGGGEVEQHADDDYNDDYDYEEEEDDDDDDDLEGDSGGVGGGPTEEAATAAGRDEVSTFMAFFPPEIEDRVIAMTNLEASRRRPAPYGWKPMGRAEFQAYVGLLILAGVYRSRCEACESLWDSESGRSVFRAAMPLKTFRAYSSALRFDDREAREAARCRGGEDDEEGEEEEEEEGCHYDKLAPIRVVWDECARLPRMYRPGPEVTVDERLVPFRGRCPFRQYMPSKPARYGIKIWVLCDARSSYAWRMQVYTGKHDKRGPPEKNLAARVVLDLTEGLVPGRNVEPSVPFPSWPEALVLSYVAKKNKNVLLLTTCPRYVSRARQRRGGGGGEREGARAGCGKPPLVLHYNRTKGGVDNLDKVAGTYSCRRKTRRWPVALFHNMVDVAAYNAFVVWREARPGWMAGKLNRQQLFLEHLGKALALPAIRPDSPVRPSSSDSRAAVGDERESRDTPTEKRGRCRVCPRSKDVKTKNRCAQCLLHVCSRCALTYCPSCAHKG
ncbi:tumor necrosis factor alpha-induced protein 2 [Sarotherodon galilaeus]